MATIRHANQISGAVEDRPTPEDLAAAVAELDGLDAGSLRRRWRALVGGVMPPDLGRPLTLRILAYKLQAQQLGDLDKVSLRELASLDRQRVKADTCLDPPSPAINAQGGRAAPSNGRQSTICPARIARPGTLLTREYGGVLHRVMVLDEGVSWNGKGYDSLSKVAFAITGTKWNGPRFFGLRDPAPSQDAEQRPRSAAETKSAVIGRGRASQQGRSLPQRASS